MLNIKNKLRSQAELNNLQQPRQLAVLRQQHDAFEFFARDVLKLFQSDCQDICHIVPVQSL